MQYYWTLGSVLRTSRVGEKDKRLVLFSRELGRITALVRGAAAPDTHWATSFEPFSLLYLRLYERSSYFVVTGAEERVVYARILSSLSRSLKGMAVNQLVECFAGPSVQEPSLFAHHVSALSHLNLASTTEHEDLVFLQFCLTLLSELGFGLSGLNCVTCGSPIGGPAYFSVTDNGFHCERCCDASERGPLSPELVCFLRNPEGPLDHRRTLAGIALVTRLLTEVAGRLGVGPSFEKLARNTTTLFRFS
jgi:DNA repair protein RecO (recombination protein O)